jgi:AraC-like DNA-binding protein
MTHTPPRSSPQAAVPKFWRNASLPFIEAREIEDGRRVCYARHAHETFSIGAIIGGESIYSNGAHAESIRAGSVVVINPGAVHACNPIKDRPWSYLMFYVDPAWLGRRQQAAGWKNEGEFQAFATLSSSDASLFDGLRRLYATLVDAQTNIEHKSRAADAFFIGMARLLKPARRSDLPAHAELEAAARYVRENCTQPLRLKDICAAAGLSESHLIRSFKARYGMTPHAYQVNCRIEYSRTRLKQGSAIADVAIDAGFADQAHLQRVFKQLTAATPGQYQGWPYRSIPGSDRKC